ncbi:MAG: CHRD domain-containing protein [Chloroflexota bacterium]
MQAGRRRGVALQVLGSHRRNRSPEEAGRSSPGQRSMGCDVHRLQLAFVAGIVGTLALVSAVAAADPLQVSGRLAPHVENPLADPDGHGVAALTISADRTTLTYRITYADVGVPITAVYFCAGSIPREDPISITCAFAIPAAPGGPSPITGSTSIVAAQADVLASGFAVIQLDSVAGPQLAGYIEIGPPPPDTSTAASPVAGALDDGSILPALPALITFAFVLRVRSARRAGELETAALS